MTNRDITLYFVHNLLTMVEDPKGFSKYLYRRSSTKYSRKNRDLVNRRNRESRKKHLSTQRRWRANNRKAYNAYFTTEERRQKRRPYMRQWSEKQAGVNPEFVFSRNMRCRVKQALKNRATKNETTQKLLGCDWALAVQHIEKTFRPGFTWENHGVVWHIDHIRPCASFDLTDPVQQRACFHYTNLQALPVLENLQKGAKWPNG